jgi:hypothetical protein
MSDVRVYCASDLYHSCQGNALVVRAEDYDAALSELSALREELASRNEVIAMKAREVVEAQTAVTGWANKCKAAEQRNDQLMALLERAYGAIDETAGWQTLCADILEAIEPTESGASE